MVPMRDKAKGACAGADGRRTDLVCVCAQADGGEVHEGGLGGVAVVHAHAEDLWVRERRGRGVGEAWGRGDKVRREE